MPEETSVVEATVETVVDATKELTAEVANQTKTMLHLDELSKYLTWANLVKVITSVIAILIFYALYRIIKRIITKTATKRFDEKAVGAITRIIKYIFFVLIGMYVLGLFGVDLKAIWGAAGVAGLAIGFAAQTSVSNLISGFFVIAEKALKLGDFIEVSGVSGTVDTIGLLSITVHTLDNQMIRIPNSTVINSNLINYSFYDKRRFVFDLPISYDSDMDSAMLAAKEVAAKCVADKVILEDPAPAVFYDGFGDAVKLKLAVWFERARLVDTKNAVYMNAVQIFKKYGVVIPFTRYDISIVSDKKTPAAKKPALEKKILEKPALTRTSSTLSLEKKSAVKKATVKKSGVTTGKTQKTSDKKSAGKK